MTRELNVRAAPSVKDEASSTESLTASLGRSRPWAGRLCRVVLWTGARLPLSLMQVVSGGVGWLSGTLPTRSRARSLVNLQLCFPELSRRAHRKLARRSLASVARTLCEVPALWGWRRERVLGQVRSVEGLEHFERACSDGRGVIFAMPHLGSWEVAALWISAHVPMTALFRPSRLREMDPILLSGRARFGAQLVPAGLGAVRELRRSLGRGETVMILPDTSPSLGQSTFAPLFGTPAKTSTLTTRLARGSGATVLMCCAERLGIGRGFRMHFVPTEPALADRDALVATSALNAAIAALIRRFPDQYLWRYRRFRHRPDGAPSLYK